MIYARSCSHIRIAASIISRPLCALAANFLTIYSSAEPAIIPPIIETRQLCFSCVLQRMRTRFSSFSLRERSSNRLRTIVCWLDLVYIHIFLLSSKCCHRKRFWWTASSADFSGLLGFPRQTWQRRLQISTIARQNKDMNHRVRTDTAGNAHSTRKCHKKWITSKTFKEYCKWFQRWWKNNFMERQKEENTAPLRFMDSDKSKHLIVIGRILHYFNSSKKSSRVKAAGEQAK